MSESGTPWMPCLLLDGEDNNVRADAFNYNKNSNDKYGPVIALGHHPPVDEEHLMRSVDKRWREKGREGGREMGKGERGRGQRRETKTERERETERERDREKEKDREKERDKKKERKRERDREKETERRKETERERDRERGKDRERQRQKERRLSTKKVLHSIYPKT